MSTAVKRKPTPPSAKPATKVAAAPAAQYRFLHVGCGPKETAPPLPKEFTLGNWQEVRLDIDERVKPDVVSSMTDMSAVESGSMHAVWSSHNIEHLQFHDAALALKEFYRVLVPHGFVFLTCPDIQTAAEEIAKGNLFGPLYQSAAGPISAFDIVFGYAKFTKNNPFMAHKAGYTLNSLLEMFSLAGFKMPMGVRNPSKHDMFVLAYKEPLDTATARANFDALLKFY